MSPEHLKSKFELARIVKAFHYSMAGLRAAWKYEAAFKQEIILGIVLFPLAVWLGENGIERALLIGSLIAVLVAELLNSGLEAIVDLASPDIHHLAGRAKDLGSAAVCIAMFNVPITWGLVLLG